MRRISFTLVALAAFALAVAPAGARHGSSGSGGGGGDDDGRVIRTGECTGPADWKLKAKPEDGGLEVEFEVDRNRAGLRYSVVLRRNGVVFARTSAVTGGRSGSFEVERQTGNAAGTDRITATATRPASPARGR